MSGADEKDFDLAEKIAERQREAAIRRARLALAVEGTFDCQDRPNEIEAARREAVPSAAAVLRTNGTTSREREAPLMEMETAKSWLSFASLIISVGSTIWMFMSSASKRTATDLSDFKKQDAVEKKALRDSLQALTTRTQSLESDIKHLPDSRSVMELQLAIEKLAGRLGRIEENQLGMSRTVLQVQEFLMKGAA